MGLVYVNILTNIDSPRSGDPENRLQERRGVRA